MLRNRLGSITALAAVVLLALVAAGSGGAAHKQRVDAGNVVFLSTQLNAITESEAFRNITVKGFPGSVTKIDIPLGNTTFFTDRLKAEAQAGKGTIRLLGGLHGDFALVPSGTADRARSRRGAHRAG